MPIDLEGIVVGRAQVDALERLLCIRWVGGARREHVRPVEVLNVDHLSGSMGRRARRKNHGRSESASQSGAVRLRNANRLWVGRQSAWLGA